MPTQKGLHLVKSLPHELQEDHAPQKSQVDRELESLLAQFGYDGLLGQKALHFSTEVQKLNLGPAKLLEMLKKLEAPI